MIYLILYTGSCISNMVFCTLVMMYCSQYCTNIVDYKEWKIWWAVSCWLSAEATGEAITAEATATPTVARRPPSTHLAHIIAHTTASSKRLEPRTSNTKHSTKIQLKYTRHKYTTHKLIHNESIHIFFLFLLRYDYMYDYDFFVDC